MNHWERKWASKHGLDINHAKEALNRICNLINNYSVPTDEAETFILSKYPLNPPESILEKFKRGKKSKNAGKLVKICSY